MRVVDLSGHATNRESALLTKNCTEAIHMQAGRCKAQDTHSEKLNSAILHACKTRALQ